MSSMAQISTLGLLVCLAVEIPAFAQYGRYPGGSYPQGRTGTSLPSPVPGAGQQKKSGEAPLPNFTGLLRGISNKSLSLNRQDANTVEFYCSRKTTFYDGSKKIKWSVLKTGDRVSVEARRAGDGKLEAVNVRLDHGKP